MALASADARRSFDVVALGNLCVDAFLDVDAPGECVLCEDTARRLAMAMGNDAVLKDKGLLDLLEERRREDLIAPPLEAGGNSNFLIAAARLGLRAAAWGHVGPDSDGAFLVDVFESEGITHLPMEVVDADVNTTLTCYVLVDSQGNHRFCSRYDFGPWPLLPPPSEEDDKHLRGYGLCVNGFSFDELDARRIWELAVASRAADGGFVLFDPGPRCSRFAVPPLPGSPSSRSSSTV